MSVVVAAESAPPIDPELLGDALNLVGSGLIVLDAQRRVVFWNRWVESVSGISLATAAGFRLEEMFPELGQGRLLGAVEGALAQGFPSVLSQSLNRAPFPFFQHNALSGKTERVQQKIQVLPIRRAENRPHCLIEIQDVSTAVHREQVLGEQKNFLNTVLESEPEGVLVLSAHNELIQLNKAGLDMLELTSLAEARATGFAGFIVAEHRDALDRLCRKVLVGDRDVLELQVRGRRGTLRWLEIHAAPMRGAQRQVTAILGVLRDVTSQKTLLSVDRLFHAIDTRVLQGQRQQALFDFICAEVAGIFGFAAAWIGQRKKSGAVTVLAASGPATGFIETLRRSGVRWDDSPLGQGSVGRAIRSGTAQVVAVTELVSMPWFDSANQGGLRSFFSIPLILRGEIYGSFTLISQRDDSFRQASVLQGLTDIASRICVSIERAYDQEQLQLLGTALSSAANGVLITDRNGRIEWANPAFEAMLGYSRDELFGSTPRQFGFGPEKGGLFQDVLDGKVVGSAWSGESIEQHRDGSTFNVRQTITPIRDGEGDTTHFISILEDVTASRQAEESVRHLAHYDYLTDLPRRALFHDRLAQAVALAKRGSDTVALMFLDLDRFKQVNDTYGHGMGDQLLKGVAKRLLACVRESDTVARLAGDEFTIIMPTAATSANATIVAQKIVAAIAEPFEFGQVRLQIGVSIGIAFFPMDADDEEHLLKHADTAMYEAKAGGRNGFRLYRPEMQRSTTKAP
jgi:diguanylate cyclase (GGDEF)-like protein/PAS domain S-box-containing protein